MKQGINEENIPFEKLQLLGIDKKRYESMPEEIKKSLLNGEKTPLIQAEIKTSDDKKVTMPMKIQLVRGADGETNVMTYPVRKEIANNLQLRAGDIDKLVKGDVLIRPFLADGQEKTFYLQLDRDTKSIMRRKTEDVKLEERLLEMEKVNDIQLGANQKQAAREGKPMELTVGDQKVSVGVDLRQPQGFKVINGDMKEWERQQKIRYDDAHPEYMGYVMTDKNRWEYQQVVKHDEQDRAIKFGRKTTTEKETYKPSMKR